MGKQNALMLRWKFTFKLISTTYKMIRFLSFAWQNSLQIDALLAFLSDASSTKHIKIMRSMDHPRDKNALRQLLGKEKSKFDQSPKIRTLKSESLTCA
jgi:hypothetical protein